MKDQVTAQLNYEKKTSILIKWKIEYSFKIYYKILIDTNTNRFTYVS